MSLDALIVPQGPRVDSLYAMSAARPNMLINGDGLIAQTGYQNLAAATADDSYGGADCWYHLCETSCKSYGHTTDRSFVDVEQTEVAAQRIGIAQITESIACAPALGRPIALSGEIVTLAAASVQYVVLAWTGTADAVTSDVVLDWTSTDYTPGGFFAASNLEVLAIGSIETDGLGPWFDLPPIIGDIGTTAATNLITFFWTANQMAQGTAMFVRAKLEQGTVATPLLPSDFTTEYLKCSRHYWQTSVYGVLPAQNSGDTVGALVIQFPTGGTGAGRVDVRHPTPMRAIPTVTTYNPAAAATSWRDVTTPANRVAAVVAANSSNQNTTISIAGAVAGANNYLHASFDARL